MLKNDDVFAKLGNWLSPGEMVVALPKILRVNQAWAQLHDPEFLDLVVASNADGHLDLSLLVELTLDRFVRDSDRYRTFADVEDHLSEIVEEIQLQSSVDWTLQEVSLLALGLQAVLSTSEKETAIEKILDDPSSWKSPLACAWPVVAEKDELLIDLFSQDQMAGTLLAANMLLANSTVDEAASTLLEMMNGVLGPRQLQELQEHEPQLAQALIGRMNATPSDEPIKPHIGQSVENDLVQVMLTLQDENLEPARSLLERVQGMSAEVHAMAFEQSASLSAKEGDQEAKIDSLHQAELIHSSPLRRAILSIHYIDAGEIEKAHELVAQAPESIEEWIVAGILASIQGEQEEAQHFFQLSMDGLRISHPVHSLILSRFQVELFEIGEIEKGIKVLKYRLNNCPADIDLLLDLANHYLNAGDPQSALEHATLAHVLMPNSHEVKRVLGSALEEVGRPSEALAHWNELAQSEPLAGIRVASCALKAEFYGLAIDTAETLLEGDPAVVTEAQVIIGRAMCGQDQFEKASELLEAITLGHPEETEAWIALADCHDQSGDHERAGQVLSSGIQLNPSDAQLKHAYSLWLEGDGRISEALEAATQANQIDSKNYPASLTLGRLLNILGHHEQALPILQAAVNSKPYQFQGRMELAKTFEALGQFPDAYRLVEKFPENVETEDFLHAGKLALRYAKASGDLAAVRVGKKYLSIASKRGLQRPADQYWLGVASEIEGLPHDALKAYQASLPTIDREAPENLLDNYLGIGRVSLELGNPTDAITSLEEAREKFPHSVPSLVALSHAYFDAGDREKASESISAALDLNPTNREAIDQMSRIAGITGDWAPVLSALHTLADEYPDDPYTWLYFAEQAHIANEPGESDHGMAKALTLGRRNGNFLKEASRTAVKTNRPKSALLFLNRARSIAPEDSSILKQLAEVADKAGETDLAQETWIQYAKKEPHDSEALAAAAHALESSGRKAEAKNLWLQALESDPKNARALTAIAQLLIADGDSQGSLHYLKKAILRHPDDVNLVITTARLALQAKEFAFAQSTLEEALRSAPSNRGILEVLAETYYRAGEYERAEAVLNSLEDQGTNSLTEICLSALISYHQLDLVDAMTKLISVRMSQNSSIEERILYSEAALTLMKWVDAVECFGDAKDDRSLLAELRARIRGAEAWVIFRQCNARFHSPPTEFQDPSHLAQIDRLLDQIPEGSSQAVELSIRAGLLANPSDQDLILKGNELASAGRSSELLEAIGLAYLRRGEPSKAINTIAIRDDVGIENPWLDLIVGMCQMKLDQYSSSRQAFLTAAADPILLPLSKYNLARASIHLGNIEDSRAELNEAVLLWPEESSWQYQLGGLYIEAGDLDSALPHLQEAAEASPKHGLYQITLARALRDLGNISQAFELFKETLDNNTTSDDIWTEAGQLALASGHPDIAHEWFDRARRIHPIDPQVLVGSAKSALALGDSKTALNYAKTALRSSPDDPDVLIIAGEVLEQEGKIDKALDSYALALGRVSDPLPVQIARSRLLIRSGEAVKAMSEVESLLQEHEDRPDLWAAYAEACENANELQKGMDAASKAVQLSPNDIQYQLLLARISRKSGQLDHALSELARIESKNPTNATVHVERGKLHEERREFSDALGAYRRAIECQPVEAEAYFRSGIILKQMKRYSEAGDMLRLAVEHAPKDPELLHQLAAVRALELVHGNIFEAVNP